MKRFRAVAGFCLGVVGLMVVLGTAGFGSESADRQVAAAPLVDAVTCRGFITPALSADRVRVCDTVTVTTRAEATCSRCVDGLNVVFLLQLEPC